MVEGRRAVVLLSGGLDSATCLAMTIEQGFVPFAISLRYGQRHGAELLAAQRVAAVLGVREHKIVSVDLAALGGSALTDHSIAVPERGPSDSIPVTYVPARNTVFLAIALGYAEVLGAQDIFIGANVVDYSGYPDCRPEYLAAFERLANLATRAGVEGARFNIHAPLLQMKKSDIIREGYRLGIDYGLTVSCYQADEEGRACGRCDSCRLRAQGFAESGLADTTRYTDLGN